MAGHVAMERLRVLQRCNSVMRVVGGQCGLGMSTALCKKAIPDLLNGMCPSYSWMINHFDFTLAESSALAASKQPVITGD